MHDLKEQRIAAGYRTATRFALHIGMKPSTYTAIENNSYEPSEAAKERIAISLGKEVENVFQENKPTSMDEVSFVKKTKIFMMPLDQLEIALKNQFGSKLKPIKESIKEDAINEDRYIDL